MRATVLAVDAPKAGTYLVTPAETETVTLVVYDATTLSAEGARALIGADDIEILSIEWGEGPDAPDVVTLARPLTAAVEAGQPVRAIPEVTVTWAEVLIDGEDDTKTVRVGQAHQSKVALTEGPKTEPYPVVELERLPSGEDVITDVIGRGADDASQLDGALPPAVVAATEFPGGGPVEPVAPEETPELTGEGGFQAVFLYWTPDPNPPTPQLFDVHDVTDTADVADESTVIGTAGGSSFNIGPLETTDVRRYRIWARSGDQYAPEPSNVVEVGPATGFPITETEISPDSIGTPQLKAGAVTAEKVSTDVLVANSVYARDGIHIAGSSGSGIDLDATSGFRQRNIGGAPRISFPVLPTEPNVIDSDILTRGFTSTGRASFRGDENEISRNSTLFLRLGTTAPSTALQGDSSGGWEFSAVGNVPSTAWRGGFLDDTDGSWLFASMSSGTAVFKKPQINRVLPDGSTSTTVLTALPSAGGSTNEWLAANGVVRIGGNYFITATRATGGPDFIGSRPTECRVYMLDSSLALVRSWAVSTGSDFMGVIVDRIATDGTSVYTLGRYEHTSGSTPTYRTRIRRWNTSGTLQATQNFGEDLGWPHFQVGSFDFGAFRYLIGGSTSFLSTPGFRSFNSSGVEQTSENFVPNPAVERWGWDGTKFIGWTSGGISVQSHPRTTTLTLVAGYTWYDSDPAGTGTHETPLSPLRTITLPARAGAYRMTAPPPADDGGPDSPDSSRLYVGTSASTLKLQGTFLENVSVTAPSTTGAAPPTTNTFPDGVAARVVSNSGITGMDGSGRLWVGIDPTAPTDAMNLRTAQSLDAATRAVLNAAIAAAVAAEAAKSKVGKEVPIPSASTGGVNINITFATPFPPGTSVAVFLTVNSPFVTGPRVTSQSETGFTARFDRTQTGTYWFNWEAKVTNA